MLLVVGDINNFVLACTLLVFYSDNFKIVLRNELVEGVNACREKMKMPIIIDVFAPLSTC